MADNNVHLTWNGLLRALEACACNFSLARLNIQLCGSEVEVVWLHQLIYVFHTAATFIYSFIDLLFKHLLDNCSSPMFEDRNECFIKRGYVHYFIKNSVLTHLCLYLNNQWHFNDSFKIKNDPTKVTKWFTKRGIWRQETKQCIQIWGKNRDEIL